MVKKTLVEQVVNLYFAGCSVKEALKKIGEDNKEELIKEFSEVVNKNE